MTQLGRCIYAVYKITHWDTHIALPIVPVGTIPEGERLLCALRPGDNALSDRPAVD